VPDAWCVSSIRPIYKNKGDASDPNNYRGISLLSCLGKLFTSCINNRLSDFVKDNRIVGPEQAGFKSDFSTIDHIFVLKALSDLYLKKHKRLYCCYIDYQKAFDTINRSKLWSKLLSLGMQGKVLDVITNMYIKAKSCVSINGAESGYFPCHTGVRQGENLSPLLFSIYLSDLNNFLSSECTSLSYLDSIQEDLLDREVSTFFKLYLLMYADDTVLLAESPKDLQTSLNAMKEYCTLFDLKVNISKTKIMIFSRGKLRKPHSFYFGDEKLDVVNEYNYLGLIFNYNAKFNVAKKFLYQKGSRAMFALLKKIRKLALPMDIALKLFNNLVKPVILYGAEVWGCENYDIFEKLQLRFCKYILSVNKSTCSNMVYGELGVMPVNIDVKTRMIVYWAKLICGNQGKISNLIYSLLYKLDQLNIFKSDWIHTIKSILNNSGFSGIWLSQSIPHSVDNLRDNNKY